MRGSKSRPILQNRHHILRAVRQGREHLHPLLPAEMPPYRLPRRLRPPTRHEFRRMLPLLPPHPRRSHLLRPWRHIPGLEVLLRQL